MHPDAIRALYQIERGTAALVTDAIRRLASNPHPPDAQPVVERPGVYTINAVGHRVGYQVNETERIVNVVWIE
jgi:mRNA-degrading endonuclease RelE of RelBE toxin-antitoxin system